MKNTKIRRGRPQKPRPLGFTKALSVYGTVGGMAKKLGTKIQSVSQWKDLPPERCLDVHKQTGIPLHELRPDIYPKPPKQPRKRSGLASLVF